MKPAQLPVVIVGAGLAGLAAAATAAQAGVPVLILDSRSPGGRARTEVRDGFRLNEGPHALYRGGPGRRVLSRLGVRAVGHSPRLRRSRALVGGQLRPFPLAQVTRMVARLAVTSPNSQAGRSASEWIASLRLPRDDASYVAAFIRNTSYVADLDQMPAGLAITQMRTALRGVDYIDGGWARLTSGLLARATAAGAQLRAHVRAEQVERSGDTWEVHADGTVIPAAAVVVAAGRPGAARRLLPGLLPSGQDWDEPGPEVTAACLDLGLLRTGTRYVLGIDEPLYLSPHCPPGDLAPAGCELVHLMRYGASDPATDREQLWNLAAAAGIGRDDVTVERFLPRMVVVSRLPSPRHGLAGRAPVAVPGPVGLFLAGDWVGPAGWLADGSLASGEQAGQLAARAARRTRGTEHAVGGFMPGVA